MSLALKGAGSTGSGAAFTPLSLSPAGWWDASQITPVADGTAISSWSDLSGNGRHLVQATGAKQPLYKTAIQNGRPIIRFDGTDDALLYATNLAFMHAIIVAKYPAATFGVFPGLLSGAVGNANETILLGEQATGNFYNELSITTVFHKDGTALAETAMSGPMNAFSVSSISYATGWNCNVQVGHDRANAARYFGGDVAELLVFTSVLSSTDRQSVEAYLRSKWGTP